MTKLENGLTIFSKKPCKHAESSKVIGRWNFLKSNPNKIKVKYCHTCGHVQELSK